MTTVVHALDSLVYGASYTTPEMRAIFDEVNVQRQRMRFEGELARQQAALGIIPDDAAAEIVEACAGDVPLAEIASHTAETGNDVVALTRALSARMGRSGAEYIHYGATSQDVHITGQALLLKDAVAALEVSLVELVVVLRRIAAEHRDTLIAGRTHGQHAIPTTFGHKVAGWLHSALERLDALRELAPRLLVGSLKGAVGNHAVWPEHGFALEEAVMSALGVGVAPVNIQPSQERYGEYLSWCAVTSTLLARICSEIRSLHRTEVAEVREAFVTGKTIGSSTMPHKRNADWSEATHGLAFKVRSNAMAMLTVLQEHERDATRNPAEHLLIAETSALLHRMLVSVATGMDSLEVDTDRMRRNLDLTGGLIATEHVTFLLAERSGAKDTAHGAVYRCAMESFERELPLVDVLAADSWVSQWASADELRAAVDEAIEEKGTAPLQVDRIVALADNVAN